jgi:hypothetical protein
MAELPALRDLMTLAIRKVIGTYLNGARHATTLA